MRHKIDFRRLMMVVGACIIIAALLIQGCAKPAPAPAPTPTPAPAPAPAPKPTPKPKEVDFPTKTIIWVVPWNPGGGYDTYARAIAPVMSKYLPKKVDILIKNVPGAKGRRGVNYTYKAKPDGYTIGMTSMPGHFITSVLVKTDYDVSKFAWIGRIAADISILYVRGDSPINSMDDLKAEVAKTTLNWAGGSKGSTTYYASKIMLAEVGLTGKVNYVSGYAGTSDSIVGLLRGDIDFLVIGGVAGPIPYVQAGDLKPIAVIDNQRSSLYPDVPTFVELGYTGVGQDVNLQRPLFCAPGTPKNRVKILETALLKALDDPQVKAWAKKTGSFLAPLPGDQVGAAIQKATETILKHKQVLLEELE